MSAGDQMASDEIAQAWDREIERRIAAYRAGATQVHDLEEVLEEVLEEARRLAPDSGSA